MFLVDVFNFEFQRRQAEVYLLNGGVRLIQAVLLQVLLDFEKLRMGRFELRVHL
jgi:hypothetical protein